MYLFLSVKNNAIDGKDRETVIKLFEEYEFDYDFIRKTNSYIFQQKKQRLMQSVQRIIPLPEASEEKTGEEDDDEFAFIEQREEEEERVELERTNKEGSEDEPLLRTSLTESKTTAQKDQLFSPHSSIDSLPNASQITGSVATLTHGKEEATKVDGRESRSKEGSVERKRSSLEEEDETDDAEEIPDELSEMTDLESIDKRDKLCFIV